MTQLDKLNDSLMPAHQRVIQLWVQSCCHLQDLSWGPGLHKEGAAIDITHLAQVALEAGRLVGATRPSLKLNLLLAWGMAPSTK